MKKDMKDKMPYGCKTICTECLNH